MAFEETPIVGGGKLVKVGGPLIKVPKGKWVRDPGISELLDYFDDPRFLDLKGRQDRWSRLKVGEISEITKVIDRCRNDFQYAARNFFWISTKDRGEKLFSLWEAQELILEYMMQLKARGIAQRVICVKARQLGCSTLIEALIAWRAMFFQNVTAFVIADEPARAAKLFGIMQYIYDRCPWWMQPMCSSRQFQDGLIFENKNPDDRRANPGLNSQVIVNAANKLTGVAQGYSVSAAHLSEFPSWKPERRAREIIEEDLGNALADNPETFAFLEGTAKGAGSYAHRLWIKSINAGDDAKWFPKFLPWFFEVNRTRTVPPDWEPEAPEVEMNERVERDWTRCENKECRQYHERFWRGKDRDGDNCPTCEDGVLKAYRLTREQCAWMAHERKDTQGDADSVRNLRQEMCLTATEAFQISGTKVFSDQALSWAEQCVEEPLAVGMLDGKLKFHGCDPRKKLPTSTPGEFWNPCYQKDCNANHKFDPAHLKIWRWPQMGRKYVIGGDVAEGLGGDSNSSVGFVLMEGALNEPDEQVATYSSNEIDRIGFAQILVWLGMFYNKALLAIESNRYDTVAWTVQEKFMYPNCYRSRLQGTNNVSVKLGWETTEKSKSRIYDTFRRWMEYKELKIRSRNLVEEMKTFKREDNEKGNGRGTYSAAKGFQDDELLAAMISLFVAHAGDYDENLGYVVMRADLSMENAIWHMSCGSCFERWPANSLQDANNCPRCKSMHVSGVKNATYTPKELADPEEEAKTLSFYNDAWARAEAGITTPAGEFMVPDYDDL